MRRVAIVAVAILLGFGLVWGESGYRWSAGLKFGYMTVPNFLLDAFYEKHTSISATPLGAEFGFKFEGFDLFVSLNHYFLNFEDGKWLRKGEDESETDYVTTDIDLTSLEVQTMWRLPLADWVDYRIGFGLGIGVLSGHYYSEDVDPDTGKRIEGSKEEPTRPSVIPTGGFTTGFSFYPYSAMDIHLDIGLLPGFYIGLGTRFLF